MNTDDLERLIQDIDAQPSLPAPPPARPRGPHDIPNYPLDPTERPREGGTARIYPVFDALHNRRLALRTPKNFPVAPSVRRQFLQAARLQGRFPPSIGIAHVITSDEWNLRPYMIMTWFAGPTLAAWRPGRRPYGQVARLVQDLAKTLAVVHKAGIVHCDLKPTNVLIDGELSDNAVPKVLITDFGLAVEAGPDGAWPVDGRGNCTPHYAAPEQAVGATGPIGPWTDVFALGVMFRDWLQSVARPPGSGFSPQTPADLVALCNLCLAPEPHARVTAPFLVEELDRYRTNQPIASRPRGSVSRFVLACRRNPVKAISWTIGLAALLTVVGLTAFYTNRLNQTRTELTNTESLRSSAESALNATVAQTRTLQTERDKLSSDIQTQRRNALAADLFRRLDGPAAEAMPTLAALHREFDRTDPARRAAIATRFNGLLAEGPYYAPATRLRHESAIQSVAHAQTGDRLVTFETGGVVRSWNLAAGGETPDWTRPAVSQGGALSPDGTRVAVFARGASQWVLLDAANGEVVGKTVAFAGDAESLRFSRGGRFVGGVTSERRPNEDRRRQHCVVWDLKGDLVATLPEQPAGASVALFEILDADEANAPSRALVVWSNGQGALYDLPAPSIVWQALLIDTKHGVKFATLSPDGDRLIVIPDSVLGGMAGTVVSAYTGRPEGQPIPPVTHRNYGFAAFLPDGRSVAIPTTTTGNGVTILKLPLRDRPDAEELPHDVKVTRIRFSPDGRTCATLDEAGDIRLWNVPTHRPLPLPLRHPYRVDDVVFAPNGIGLLTTGSRPAPPPPADVVLTRRLGSTDPPNQTQSSAGRVLQLEDTAGGPRWVRLVDERGTQGHEQASAIIIGEGPGGGGRTLEWPEPTKPILDWSPARRWFLTSTHRQVDGGGSVPEIRAWTTADLRPLGPPIPLTPTKSPYMIAAPAADTPRIAVVESGDFLAKPARATIAVVRWTGDAWHRAEWLHEFPTAFPPICWLPDQRHLIVAVGPREVRVWDADAAAEVPNHPAARPPSADVVALAAGRRLELAADNAARVIGPDGVAVGPGFTIPADVSVRSFSEDGTRFWALIGRDTELVVWDVATGREALRWRADGGRKFGSVAFAPGGMTVSAVLHPPTDLNWPSDTAGEVVLWWPVLDGAATTLKPPGAVTDVTFGAGGDTLVFGASSPLRRNAGSFDSGEQVVIWDLPSRTPVGAVPSKYRVEQLVARADGRVAVAGQGKAFLFALDTQLPQGREPVDLGGDASVLTPALPAAVLTTDGRRFLGITNQVPGKPKGAWRLTGFDFSSGSPLAAKSPDYPQSAFFGSPCPGPRGDVVALFAANRVWVCDAETGAKVGRPFTTARQVTAVAFDAGGTRLVVATGNIDEAGGTVEVWNWMTGTRLAEPSQHGFPVNALAVTDSVVASGSEDRTARVWDLATGVARTPALIHLGPVEQLALSATGQRLATAGPSPTEVRRDGGAVRVWDARTGEPLTPSLPIAGSVRAVRFSPDGRTLVAAGNLQVRIWPLDRPVSTPDDVVILVELLACRRLNERLELTGFDTDEWFRGWADVRAKPPFAFATPAEWHRWAAGRALAGNDLMISDEMPEAIWHVDRALAAAPDDLATQLRAARVVTRWADRSEEIWRVPANAGTGDPFAEDRPRIAKRRLKAADLFARVLERRPNWWWVRLDRARTLLAAGKEQDADAEYAKVLEATGDYWWPKGVWAAAKARGGRPDEGIRLWDLLAGAEPNNGLIAFHAAEALAGAGRWADAARRYDVAVRCNPDAFEAWAGLGRARLESRQSETALADLEQALARAPDVDAEWRCRYNRAIANCDLNRWQPARDDCLRCVAMRPNLGLGWMQLGIAQQMGGRHAEAKSSYTRALKKELAAEDQGRCHIGRAYTAFDMRPIGTMPPALIDDTAADIESAACFGLHDEEYWSARGRIAIERRRWDDAVDALTRVVAAKPARIDDWRLLGVAEFGRGRFADATTALERVSSIPGAIAFDGYCRAVAARAAGQSERAVSAARWARSIVPTTGPIDGIAAANVLLAAALAEDVDDVGPYVAAVETAVKADPDQRWMYVALALSAVRAGRPDDAVRWVRESQLAHGRVRQQLREGGGAKVIPAAADPADGTPIDWLVLALGHHKAGRTEEAGRWLARAVKAIEKGGLAAEPPANWSPDPQGEIERMAYQLWEGANHLYWPLDRVEKLLLTEARAAINRP